MDLPLTRGQGPACTDGTCVCGQCVKRPTCENRPCADCASETGHGEEAVFYAQDHCDDFTRKPTDDDIAAQGQVLYKVLSAPPPVPKRVCPLLAASANNDTCPESHQCMWWCEIYVVGEGRWKGCAVQAIALKVAGGSLV